MTNIPLDMDWTVKDGLALEGKFLCYHLATKIASRKQANLAVELDVDASTFNRWVKGTSPVTDDRLSQISERVCRDVITLVERNNRIRDFKESFEFLQKSGRLGRVHDGKMPEMARAFLEMLGLPTRPGEPVSSDSDIKVAQALHRSKTEPKKQTNVGTVPAPRAVERWWKKRAEPLFRVLRSVLPSSLLSRFFYVTALITAAFLSVLYSLTLSLTGDSANVQHETSRAQLQTALTALDANDLSGYIEGLHKSASLNDSTALLALGVAYGQGLGVNANEEQSEVYFEAAVSNGVLDLASKDPTVQYFMALRDYYGLSTAQDTSSALSLLKQSKAGGFARSSLQLAQHALDTETKDDDCAGLQEAKIAKSSGVILAHGLLGRMLQTGFCLDKDTEEARHIYSEYFDLGFDDFALEYAGMLENGDGGPAKPAQAYEIYKQLAAKKNANATLRLGVMTYLGRGIQSDKNSASRILENASDLIETQAYPMKAGKGDYEVGQAFYRDNLGSDVDAYAAKWFRIAAAKNHEVAIARLGAMYLNGYGVTQSDPSAKNYLERSHALGYGQATADLAWMLMKARGGDADYPRAYRLMTLAAEAGIPSAQNWLGYMYNNGVGIEKKDPLRAKQWYERATRNGSDWAPNNLSLFYLTQGASQEEIEKGLSLLDLSIERGLIDAITTKGTLYYEGKIVSRDDEKAYHLFKEATEAGDKWGPYYLGKMHERSNFIKRNMLTAVDFYEQSSNRGNASAENTLGWLYSNSKELGIDREKAFFWFHKAAMNGDAQAKENLGVIYRTGGLGVKKDAQLAFKWFEEASLDGRIKSLRIMAMMHASGELSEVNFTESERLLRLAANSGDIRSRIELALLLFVKPRSIERDSEIHSHIIQAVNSADAVDDVTLLGRSVAILSLLNVYGVGVPKDIRVAEYNCELSRDYGEDLYYNLCLGATFIQAEPKSFFANPDGAFSALDAAGRQGLGIAYNILGIGMLRGVFGPNRIDPVEIESAFQLASDLGSADAAVNLFLLQMQHHGSPLSDTISKVKAYATGGHIPSKDILAFWELNQTKRKRDLLLSADIISDLVAEGSFSRHDANTLLNSTFEGDLLRTIEAKGLTVLSLDPKMDQTPSLHEALSSIR
ncbi:MAG: hypothetical protein AAFR39_06110 [Pseudomonadota bacterium]